MQKILLALCLTVGLSARATMPPVVLASEQDRAGKDHAKIVAATGVVGAVVSLVIDVRKKWDITSVPRNQIEIVQDATSEPVGWKDKRAGTGAPVHPMPVSIWGALRNAGTFAGLAALTMGVMLGFDLHPLAPVGL